MDEKTRPHNGKLVTQQGNLSVALTSNAIVTTEKNTSNGYSQKPLTETILNGFFTVDRFWTVLYWNNAAEQLLGVQAKDIVGKNLWKEFTGIIPINFYAVYHKAFRQNSPIFFEEYWGEMGAWFDVIVYHSEDMLSVSFKNSNKSEQPALQLKTLNELYKFITEVTNDCLWEWDLPNKEIFWIDGGHKRVFGYQIENALIPQLFWESCLHPDDKARVLASIAKIISKGSGSIWEEEYRFRKSDGDYSYVHDRGHIIYNESGKASRIIGATQDITARKLIERKLLESERKLSLIARQTVNAIILTDPEERITWVNSAFTHITGYDPEDVIGKKPGAILQGEKTDAKTVQYLKQRIKDKQPFDCVIANYTKTGEKYWVHIQGQAMLDEKGNCNQFFAIQTDITEKILQENTLAMERVARQKEITEAVLIAQEKEREHIGKELHDNLNQTLAAAKMYIQMGRAYDEKSDAHLDESCRLLQNVMENIRKIAKNLLIPGVHIIGLFDNMKNLIHDLMQIDPIKVEFYEGGIKEEDLNEKLQLVILRVVQEQMNNILQHSNATCASIDLRRKDNDIVLLISDNGKGLDPLKEKRGVGIINIKNRVELYNGTVTIISTPGKGYLLKVVLPLGNNI